MPIRNLRIVAIQKTLMRQRDILSAFFAIKTNSIIELLDFYLIMKEVLYEIQQGL